MAFIKATKHHHWASTRSDITKPDTLRRLFHLNASRAKQGQLHRPLPIVLLPLSSLLSPIALLPYVALDAQRSVARP